MEDDQVLYDADDDNYNNGCYIDTDLPVMRLQTPFEVDLCGMYGRSFAYFSLKERIPVILTKIIDYLSRDGGSIKSANGASEEDLKNFMQSVVKLKNDLVTNKDYDPFTVDTANAKKWNMWIENQENKKYFNNTWMFTECYLYRKLREGCELTKGLQKFDYFEAQKKSAFDNNVELMCIVADKMVTMVNKSEKDKRKADFITLLKICLWANKCDLSLSLGSQVNLIQAAKDATEKLRLNPPPPPPPPKKGKKGKPAKEAAPQAPLVISHDPFQMILDLKDKLLVDDTAKIADQVQNKADAMLKAINANTTFKFKCSCHRLATLAGVPLCKDEAAEEVKDTKDAKDTKDTKDKKETKEAAPAEAKDGKEKKEDAPKPIPCPAKMTVPQAVMFDIVCDNTGYELFADLCLAHFLVAQKIVQKVRFHVKDMPWFISDVTEKDFRYVIDACSNSNFSKEASSGATEGEGGAPKIIKADNLRLLGQAWNQYLTDGVFQVMAEEFWTTPHVYRDMKKYDPILYRKLQYAVAIMFKGDLNYRKLLGDRNVNPTTGFEASLQGFIPAPIIAVRTVKAELICGLPKGKWDQLTTADEKWMQSGDYGVIQFCPKGEALKVSDRPCMDYCQTCFGVVCPEHTDI
ncbi:damage-control phosphatase ARMT1 isoform X3 [Spodoptera frugiperda]|uniref:Damage-control phosphatase ARMT1 n=1 Tax=Spodoptera frugiperda TaxID=7108 RepID=A0A9R0DYM5_SPOFR|nr:damage-control phosphatase ARMT1 isoform X3 [Spodoptera frugiperda]